MRFIHNKAFRKASKTGEIQEIFQDKEKVFALSEAFWEENARPLLIYAGTGVYKLSELETSAQGVVEHEVVDGGHRHVQEDRSDVRKPVALIGFGVGVLPE